MNQKVTISDIAKAAGVSISSVHLALNNKSGVSDATRERIRKVAEEMDYSPNVFASNLKRDASTILVVLPDRSAVTDRYYAVMWDAAKDSESAVSSYNIRINCRSFSQAVKALEEEENLGGIVVAVLDDFSDSGVYKALSRAEVPLITVDSEILSLNGCCCFASDPRDVGYLTGEMLIDTIRRPDGKILVLGAGPSYANRAAIQSYLAEELETAGLKERMLLINKDEADEKCLRAVEEALTQNIIIGACAINSRSTPLLCKAIENTGRKGLFPVIGSGFFEDSKAALMNRTLTAIIDKKPYEQCYRAIAAMTGILARGIMPEDKFVPVRLDVILRNNSIRYESYRMI